jgi:hypothetical protein
MQLGTRWTAGEQPPAAVPAELHAQIAAVESDLPTDQLGQPNPRWTLTWLERRPVAELDTGVIVTLDASGQAVVRHDDDEQFSNRDHSTH